MTPQKETVFMQLIEAHKGMLFKICRLYQDDPADRDDLMQEIVMQLWQAFDSFKGNSAFGTWLYRVALNTAMMFFKKQQRRPDREQMPAGMDTPDTIGYDNTRDEQLALFHRALKHLDKVDKAIIFLYMEDQPYTEIAASIGISEGAARVRVNRAKNKLKDIIKSFDYEY